MGFSYGIRQNYELCTPVRNSVFFHDVISTVMVRVPCLEQDTVAKISFFLRIVGRGSWFRVGGARRRGGRSRGQIRSAMSLFGIGRYRSAPSRLVFLLDPNQVAQFLDLFFPFYLFVLVFSCVQWARNCGLVVEIVFGSVMILDDWKSDFDRLDESRKPNCGQMLCGFDQEREALGQSRRVLS